LWEAARLRAAYVTPRDFAGGPTDEPVVLVWKQICATQQNVIRKDSNR
jgi:hypothetical protein